MRHATRAVTVDDTVCDEAMTTPTPSTMDAMAGRPTNALRRRPTASCRGGIEKVAKRPGSRVGSEPKAKIGRRIQSTIPAAPPIVTTSRATSGSPRRTATPTASATTTNAP